MILQVSECYFFFFFFFFFFCNITVEQEYPRYPKAYNSIFPVVNTISTDLYIYIMLYYL